MSIFGVDSITGQGLSAFKATSRALHTWMASLLRGEDETFNRLWGGQAVAHSAAASATGTALSGPQAVVGIRVTASASGVLTVYDNTSAAGTQVWTSLAVTANTTYLLAGGAAEFFDLGVHIVLVSGTATWEVLYVPAV